VILRGRRKETEGVIIYDSSRVSVRNRLGRIRTGSHLPRELAFASRISKKEV
jgi:3-phenylpropionate/cinnamic acid dioxygenase small subunit